MSTRSQALLSHGTFEQALAICRQFAKSAYVARCHLGVGKDSWDRTLDPVHQRSGNLLHVALDHRPRATAFAGTVIETVAERA